MNRRMLLGSALAAALPALPALAQHGDARMVRIGWLVFQGEAALAPYLGAFRAGLADAGYVEGRNLLIEYRYAEGAAERLPVMARELVDLPVSILLTMGRATAPVARLGLPVPVVFVLSGDPILAGVTESLARPNSNLTGLTLLAAELHAKRVEILHDMLPDLHRIAVIGDPEHPGVELEHAHVREVARQLGIDVDFHPIRSRAELDMAFAALIEAPPQALCVFSDGSSLENKDRIAGFGLHRRLPVMTSWALFAQAGALCSYTRRAKC